MVIKPDLEPNKKKFDALEPILQKVNKEISLSDSDIRASQTVIDEVVGGIIKEMKNLDPMFKKMYQRILYGGSYYDGVKIKHPDEFDLDLVIKLPKILKYSLVVSDSSGFVRLKLNNFESFRKNPDFNAFYRKMEKWLNESHYVLIDKFRSWFEGLVIKASQVETIKSYKFRIRKSGPAITLEIDMGVRNLSVDLVPCLVFTSIDWPHHPFRRNMVLSRPDFLIVPKGPRGPQSNDPDWRLSFQEQERYLINGKNRLKDTIRLLKLLKLRQMQDAIPSYYIKTIALWMTELIPDDNFWSTHSLSYAFMMGLKYMHKLLKAQEIPYFWNENNNLMKAKNVTILQWAQRVEHLIGKIERSMNDPKELNNVIKNIFGLDEENVMVMGGVPQSNNESCVII